MGVSLDMLARARGCLMGQLVGDSLGSLVEFMSAEDIARRYPEGVRDLADGGTWDTLAGQPTDDSEMALALARTLVRGESYDPIAVKAAYVAWLGSGPFDVGITVSSGLSGSLRTESQANGALMRASPLGIFGAGRPDDVVEEWARADAALTHPHQACADANVLLVLAIAHAVAEGLSADDLYALVVSWAAERVTDEGVRAAVAAAAEEPPRDFLTKQGWVLIALQNALFRLLNAPSAEAAIVETVGRGGDTDTNAAICGALLGAVHGIEALPHRWVEKVLDCRPQAGVPGVKRPRPEVYWPVDALDLAAGLLPQA